MKYSYQTPSEYIIRPTKPKEYSELNKAYNHFTGRSRTSRQFLWQWVDTPFEKSEIWSIEQCSSSTIVGHHGVMTLPFVKNGQSISVGKSENTFVFPEHRSQLFYPALEKKALRQMRSKYKYIFTTASEVGNGVIGKIRRRHDYFVHVPSICYLLGANFKSLKKLFRERFPTFKWLSGAAAFTIKIIFNLPRCVGGNDASKTNVILHQWAQLNEFENFWRKNCRFYGITADRNQNYYRWRFAENPHNRYFLFKLTQAGRTIGFAVTSKKTIKTKNSVFESVMIEDIIVEKGEFKYYLNAFSALTKYLAWADLILFVTLKQNDPVNGAIKRLLGPIAKKSYKIGPKLLVWGYSESDPPWYFTNILSEGTNYDVSHSF